MHEAKMMAMGVIIAVVFIVAMNENLQAVEGLAQVGNRLLYNVDVGESQILQWGMINTEDEDREIQFYATGRGAELLHFEEFAIMEPGEFRNFDFIVVVPDNHPDNVEYQITLNALDRGSLLDSGDTGIQVQMIMQQNPRIYIGENPVYTYEPPVKVEIENEKVIVPDSEPIYAAGENIPESETLEEKLQRIKDANKESTTPEISPIDTPIVEKTVTSSSDNNYVAEPVMDTAPVVKPIVAEEEGGGCLIATAAFGSELAPQVQLLREIRDNQLMNSNSGIAFMSAFNQFYYSFSPYIADMERDSPIFKEVVKLTLTPMLSTLSVMAYANSEDKVLGLGIGAILMNLGMYLGLPTFGIVKLIQFRKK